MSSTHVDALARLVTALLLVPAIPGCKFEPAGGGPGGGTPVDGQIPVDGMTPGDGSPITPSDGSTPIDGPPVGDVDARGNPQRRKQITIRASEVEAPATPGFLADFPVLFAVVDAQIAARASADGSDIYFVDADGTTRLDHEIEKWNAGTGELIAWVKLPSVSATEDTVFHVYYGDPAQANPVDPADVWSSSFAAVWHLAESPGPGDTGDIRDSTGGNDGTAHSSMQENDRVAAQIGDGIDFDGMDDEIAFQNPISGGGPHTISVWVNQRSPAGFEAMVVLGEGAGNRARWFYSVYFGDEVATGFFANDWTDTGADIRGDGWTLLHWTYDDNRDNVVYVNGASVGTNRAANGVDTRGSDGRLGNVPSGAFGGGLNLAGLLDEARIATVARPAEWIRTEFNNQSDPASFCTVGPEATP